MPEPPQFRAELDFDISFANGIVVDLAGSHVRAIGASHLLPYDVADKAVLIRTGWDVRWGSEEYHTGHPFLTAAAAFPVRAFATWPA